MALQDLTPQLRTRLSRMERAVGWFVIFAMVLLGLGFGYYVYNTAQRKGWFVTKAPFFTFVQSATGLKVGDPVQLMGFNVGQITEIEGMAPFSGYNVFVRFEIKAPYFDYLWTQGSDAKVAAAGLLANRVIEVTKGTNGYPAYTEHALRVASLNDIEGMADRTNWGLAQEVFAPHSTNLIAKPWQPLTNLAEIAAAGYTNLVIMDKKQKRGSLSGVWDDKRRQYDFYSSTNKPYWLHSEESPAVTEQAQQLVAQVQAALPGVFSLTNELSRVLTNSAGLTSNLNFVVESLRPAASNLSIASAGLKQPGGLGEWLLPTNLNHQLETTLRTANLTLTNANTNLAALGQNVTLSLENLAGITSNLNHQVQINTNLLSSISKAVVDADNFVEGLKHFWLLRSAFKPKKTNAPVIVPAHPLLSPKAKSER